MSRTTVAAVVLAVCLVLAGCSGAGGGAGGSDGGDAGAATVGGDADRGMAEPTDDGNAGDGGDATDPADAADPAARQALVRTGTVTLRVEAYDPARSSLVATVRGMGGYVGNSERTRHRDGNRTWTTGQVVLRVPAERFRDLLSAARAEGTVLSERTGTEDVSDQLVDLEARLENLRARRDRLRAFYEGANDTQDLLAVEDRLSEVQGEIERLQARKAALEESVAYSTLTVKLREPEPDPDPEPTTDDDGQAFHQRSIVGAFLDSVGALVLLLETAVVAAAYLAPFALAVGIPVGAVGIVAWRRRGGG